MKNTLLKLITGVALTFSVGANGQVISQDSLALVDLYNSTNGASWSTNTNWLSAQPVSTWHGVVVVGDRVKELWLTNNNLTGTLPASIGDLNEMRTLALSGNGITGSIPTEMGNCAYLAWLYLDNNSFSGSVPSFFSGLTLLREYYLNGNNLSGSIPAGAFTNSNLRAIGLNDNSLDGSIPSMSALTNLNYLYLFNNNLTGSIPSDISSCTSLYEAYVDNNNLDGAIPAGLNTLPNLVAFGASNNALTGSVPDFGGLSTFEWLDLSFNNLSAFSGMTASGTYYYLDVSGNSLIFEDIEPVTSAAPGTFLYSPQDSIGFSFDTTIEYLSSFTLSADDNAGSNQYQWFRNGTALSGGNSSTYTVNNATSAHNGVYTCEITNTTAPNLTIHQRPMTITVNETFSDCNIYRLDNKTLPASGNTFYVKLWAKSTVPAGIIGMDLCLNYDNLEATPTGNVVYGPVFHGGNAAHVGRKSNYDNTAGEMNITLYYDDDAPATKEFSGNGTVVWVQFTSQTNSGATSSISICGIDEGYETSVISHCRAALDKAIAPNIQEPQYSAANLTVEGKLKYWGLTGVERRLSYDAANPSVYIPTNIYKSNASCDTIPGTRTRPNKWAQFFVNFTTEPNMSIDRDIEGDYFNSSNCTDVSEWMTDNDRFIMGEIATKSSTFTPTVHEVIASDVNMDGMVRANDITLMYRRSAGGICEFPQTWNYSGGAPSGSDVSKDWLFVSEETIASNPDYTIDGTYPNSSGVGYSRDMVPMIDNCIAKPNTAQSSITLFYHAILLGDPSANWTRNDGGQARMANGIAMEELQNINIQSYPTMRNPNLTFNIDDQSNYNYSFRVFNVYGQEVVNESVPANQTVDVSFDDYSKGIYILNFSTAEGTQSIKILYQ